MYACAMACCCAVGGAKVLGVDIDIDMVVEGIGGSEVMS